MTTLGADALLTFEIGSIQEYPVIASDIIYGHAAVGLVAASGHARPLVAGDKFAGFAEKRVDNSSGGAAAKNVRVAHTGKIQLAITGAVITDQAVENLPVYASDDATFSFDPVGGTFVGFFDRFVSSGVGMVRFDANGYRDPWWMYSKRETLTGTKTFDAEDTGKLFSVTDAGDGDALTLPAVATGVAGVTILAIGAFGTTAVTIDCDASDGVIGPDITAGDGKGLILTKATQRRGDFVTIGGAEADGYLVTQMRGIWAREG